jgi:hypothetical protein
VFSEGIIEGTLLVPDKVGWSVFSPILPLTETEGAILLEFVGTGTNDGSLLDGALEGDNTDGLDDGSNSDGMSVGLLVGTHAKGTRKQKRGVGGFVDNRTCSDGTMDGIDAADGSI